MRLSSLYTNKPDIFLPVNFNIGLNVVMGEIRVPENRNKHTHNLGKSTLGQLLDFCLLSKRDSQLFLFVQKDLFNDFVFFLEIALDNNSFVTIRRSVSQPSKISFNHHQVGHEDFTALPSSDWDHFDIPFERSRKLLDSFLGLQALKPWSFRYVLGYLLRSQNDYNDVYHLNNYKGPHSTWKPFLAHILGFDDSLVNKIYEKDKLIEEKILLEQNLRKETNFSMEDHSKIEGILLIKQKEADKIQQILDLFDFREPDKEYTQILVDDISTKIANLNEKRYYLKVNIKKILNSLEDDQILFNLTEIENLYQESGIQFPNLLKKDFQELIDFNISITNERRSYLQSELAEFESELKCVNEELDILGQKRSDTLSFLNCTDIFIKYKQLLDIIISLRSDILNLEQKLDYAHRLQNLRDEKRALKEEQNHLKVQLEKDVGKQNSDKNSLFSKIRLYFNDIVEYVIGYKALLSVSLNNNGNLDFKAEILDESGNLSCPDQGHSFRKLLCVAFDMAILLAYQNEKFPKFVFHDGVFESLDDRKKENLLAIIRRYTELGLQSIITLIDSDLPHRIVSSDKMFFSTNEIIIHLHDEGESGRLFKCKPW
jgi:uncharacterized protein YydD (DUF2326 family)